MDFKIDIDTWFMFSLLFLGALGLSILGYIVFPYYARRREIKRIRSRKKKIEEKFIGIDKKHSESKMDRLQQNNQKL